MSILTKLHFGNQPSEILICIPVVTVFDGKAVVHYSDVVLNRFAQITNFRANKLISKDVSPIFLLQNMKLA